jgi:hypothetical protein
MTGRDIRLQANFSACNAMYDAALQTWAVQPDSAGHGWNLGTAEVAPTAAPGILGPIMWTMNTIDLAGLELAKETFFPVGTSVQDPMFYYNTSNLTAAIHVIDLITDKLIDPLLAVQMTVPGGLNPLSGSNYGMQGDGNDATTIIMGNYRFKTGNTNFTYPQVMRTEQASTFSSGEPTAASKLYCYRIIIPLVDGDTTTIGIPAARFYLTGVRDEEPQLEYMMRLKRSYELDQTQS